MKGRWGVFTDILSPTVHIFCLPTWTANTSIPPNTAQSSTEIYSVGYVQNRGKQQRQTGKRNSMRALIVSCMPVWLPQSGEMKHGEDFVRLVPPKASEARTLPSIKHGTFTKYAVLHRQGPPLRASSTQQLFVLQLLSSAILGRRWIIHVMYLRQIYH